MKYTYMSYYYWKHVIWQDMKSYSFVKGIADDIKKCSGDIIITESNSGMFFGLHDLYLILLCVVIMHNIA